MKHRISKDREDGDTNKLCCKKLFQIATDFLQAKLYVYNELATL